MCFERARSQTFQIRDRFRIDLNANPVAAETLTHAEGFTSCHFGADNAKSDFASSARLMLPA